MSEVILAGERGEAIGPAIEAEITFLETNAILNQRQWLRVADMDTACGDAELGRRTFLAYLRWCKAHPERVGALGFFGEEDDIDRCCLGGFMEVAIDGRGTAQPCRQHNPRGYDRWSRGHWAQGHELTNCEECNDVRRGRYRDADA